MPRFLSPGKGVPLVLIPEYSGINKDQRIPDRSKTAHRKPPVKCFLTGTTPHWYFTGRRVRLKQVTETTQEHRPRKQKADLTPKHRLACGRCHKSWQRRDWLPLAVLFYSFRKQPCPENWARLSDLLISIRRPCGEDWASQAAVVVKNSSCQYKGCRSRRVPSLGREDPLEEGMATHSSVLAWRIPVDRAWWATVHGVAESRTCLKPLSSHTRGEDRQSRSGTSHS